MVSVECFKGLPLEYESFLIEKYDSFVTTCRYIEIFHSATDLNHMLVHDNDNLIEVLIFDNKGDTTFFLNSLSFIKQELIEIFKNYLFTNFPQINKIELSSSYMDYSLEKSILTIRSDDFIITLPSTMDGYYLQLGSSTRSNVRKHKNKFLRDYPQSIFIIKIGTEIEESIVDKIIRLNFDRIKSKREVPHANHNDTINHFKYSQHYGCVAYIEVDGEIIAGCIAYILNGSMYSYFLSHDNNYSNYNAGQLCLLYLIEIAIEKGFSDFHLLWGKCDYKTRFLAKPRPMYSYTILNYRGLYYLILKLKESISRILYKFKKTKYSIPVRNAIKYIQKKSTKDLSKFKYIFL
ncbi:MAG: GNAT family N-acetyltransferase [Paludibacter sp.]|nr:GNAT family N-acetyltransferase [Paludibacter sp.]